MESDLVSRLNKLKQFSSDHLHPVLEGKVTRMVGLTMEAVGCKVALGDRCSVQVREDRWVESEVVGFTGNLTYLMPTEAINGIAPGARVKPLSGEGMMMVGPELLGRVVNGLGYAFVLIVVGVIKELFGFGTLLGFDILPLVQNGGWYQGNGLLILPFSSFFLIVGLIWFIRTIRPEQVEPKE